ncbi:MerR family transcriptional regulator [Clostridium hydrogeniformans]|uniref:MerR family transcriptional regulator n=1 Tax=Clostridium hydrogeniformans TaxID=349933 RepID=UPI000483156F|nr:methyltransferase domain-containing protein [Clostridium hydrogeniformans]
MEKPYYTAGVFAKKSGVTLKTIHHYHKEGILCPSSYSESGYRLYSEADFEKLQRILTLKFIGFSLEDIKNIIESDKKEDNIVNSLNMQMEIIDEKIKHLELVKKAINEAKIMKDEKNQVDWNKFINIIRVVNMEKVWRNQYKNSSNLCSRINLHELFSTNKQGWFSWLFDVIDLGEDLNILELGCGNASFWLSNKDRVPRKCNITLTDISEGMINDSIENLKAVKERFNFKVVDAEKIPYDDDKFNIVLANHMLYHVADREKAFKEIKRVLKSDGRLYASTIGNTHLRELGELVREFDSRIYLSRIKLKSEFGIETGVHELNKWFNNVELLRYEDSLVVTKVEPLVDYVLSTMGNAREILVDEKLTLFREFIQEEIDKNGSIFITKDTGVFRCSNS